MILESKLKIPEEEVPIIDKPEFERLFEDTSMPCIVVRAMSGFGKTAVCAGAARKHWENVRWYTLDMTDNEEEYFLACMEELWKTVDGKEADSKETIRLRILGLAYRAQQWNSGKMIHIVLDNLQAISSERVLQMLSLLQQYVEGYVSFVLMTNKEVPKFFLSLLARGKGRLLSAKHLRLTPEEVCSYFRGNQVLTEEVLKQITKDLYGWPVGIQCVVGELCSAGKGNGLNWSRIWQESFLSGYLEDILEANCSKQMQSFLKQAAVFDEFSWEMCQEVFAEQITRQDFEEMLSCLAFFCKVPEREDTWRCSKSFRIYLCRMLSDRKRKELYKKAALWYEGKKDFDRLSDCAIQGNHAYLLVMVIERYGTELLCKENQAAFGKMIGYLEKNNSLLSPEVSGVAAQYFYSQGDFHKMEEYLNAADSSFGRENKYSCYRSLYRALLKLEEEPEKYEKQIRNALFFLKETGDKLPYLETTDEKRLKAFMGQRESRKRNVLEIRSFGTFRVAALKDGKELAWRTRKGRELFAYLLDIRGKAVERRQLIEVLWQDEIPANAVAMLHNMIYNIRKELSAYSMETILTYENKRYRLSMDGISCDVWHIQQMTELVEKKDIVNLKKEYKSFLKYWGSYLGDIDSIWVEDRRAYYDEIYKKGCWLLAGQFAGESNYETALALYENILSLEPYSENVVEKILVLYGQQRKWEKLKKCYQDFAQVLEKDLGIVPGKEVLAAYHHYLS